MIISLFWNTNNILLNYGSTIDIYNLPQNRDSQVPRRIPNRLKQKSQNKSEKQEDYVLISRFICIFVVDNSLKATQRTEIYSNRKRISILLYS